MHYNAVTKEMTIQLQHNRTTGPCATPLVKYHVCTPLFETAFEQEKSRESRITTEREYVVYNLIDRTPWWKAGVLDPNS